MTVRVDVRTAYEPDALVYCGPEVAPRSVEIADPAIIVEVLSPSTRAIDTSVKLAGYFRVPSVAHYLIVDPVEALILHHVRSTGDTIVTHIVREGTMALDPPGLELAVADVYGRSQQFARFQHRQLAAIPAAQNIPKFLHPAVL